MFKPSRRAAVIAALFALGLSCVGPYAHAGLLGGDSESSSVEGLRLPVVGGLLTDGLLGGGLLGGGLPIDGLLGGGLPIDGELATGEDGVVAGEGVVGVLGGLAEVGAMVPGAGSVFEVLSAFSDSGSLVPGLQVLDELGLLGLLGSL